MEQDLAATVPVEKENQAETAELQESIDQIEPVGDDQEAETPQATELVEAETERDDSQRAEEALSSDIDDSLEAAVITADLAASNAPAQVEEAMERGSA